MARSPRDTVFASFNDVPINTLTGSGYDPVTHTAELKSAGARRGAGRKLGSQQD